MRRALLAVLLLGLSAQGWGATVYVRDVAGTLKWRVGAIPDAGAGTAPSPNDINQLLFDVGNDCTVVFTAGTYSGTKLDATDGVDCGKTQTIRTMEPTDPEYATYGGTVIWDCGGLADHCFANTVNVTLTGHLVGSKDTDFIVRNADSTKTGVYDGTNGTTLTLNYVTLDNNYSGFQTQGTAAIVANNCHITNSKSYIGDVNGAGSSVTWNKGLWLKNASPLRVLNGSLTANNVTSLGSSLETVLASGNTSQKATLNNCVFVGATTDASKYAVDNTSTNATFVSNNSYIGYNPFGRTVLNRTTSNSPSLNYIPRFVSARRPGIVSFVFDDANSGDYFASIANIAETYGYRLTWAVETQNMTAPRWATAVNYQSRGHEIASHAYGTDNLAALAVDALNLSVTRSKAQIQDNIAGYTVRSFVYPGYQTSATVRSAVDNAGYVAGRAGPLGGSTISFSSMQIFNTYGWLIGNAVGMVSESPTEAQIRGRVAAIAEYLNNSGGWITFVLHDGTNDSDISLQNIGYVFSELSKSNVSVMTYGDAAAYVIAHAEAISGAGGERAYTRSESHLGDASDYRPLPSSPLIGAGVGVGLATDYAGNLVRNPPAIGAYEDTSPLSTADPADGNVTLFGFGVSP